MKKMVLFLLISLLLPFAVIRCQDDEIDFDDLEQAVTLRFLDYFCPKGLRNSYNCQMAREYLWVKNCSNGNNNACLRIKRAQRAAQNKTFNEIAGLCTQWLQEEPNFKQYLTRYQFLQKRELVQLESNEDKAFMYQFRLKNTKHMFMKKLEKIQEEKVLSHLLSNLDDELDFDLKDLKLIPSANKAAKRYSKEKGITKYSL